MTDIAFNETMVWRSATSSVGPVSVLRPLPNALVRSLGPFVFLDHFGPTPTPRGKLPAHPHAGIEVMTYLMEGANEHADSLGNVGRIGPGGTQWMRAGRGILHAESALPERADTFHGLQIWARLPIAAQDSAPDYRAFQADENPTWERDGARFRLLAGRLEGRDGPIPLAIPSVMAHVSIAGAAPVAIEAPERDHEYGLYVIGAAGQVSVNDGEPMSRGMMIRLASETSAIRIAVDDPGGAEVFLVGGAPAPRPIHFGGSFVLDSPEALAEANRRYLAGEMGTLDGVPF